MTTSALHVSGHCRIFVDPVFRAKPRNVLTKIADEALTPLPNNRPGTRVSLGAESDNPLVYSE